MERRPSFLNALKWAYAASWGEKIFSALFTLVLAGILGPREYGMVSIAMIYIAFLAMFLDQGFLAALIQRKNLEQEHVDAVFWMNQVLSVGLIAISMFLSSWWAARNHAPEAATIISVLSLDILLMALINVQSAILRKAMDFRSVSISNNVGVVVGGVIGIGMAFAGFRAWALVGQQLCKDLTITVLLWRMSSWRPRFEFSWKHLKELTSFSVSNFIAQLGVFADLQASSVLLGLFFGPVAVGLYRIADRIMTSIVTMATSSIQSVALPEFSRFQHDPEQLRKSALTCIRLSSAVTLPALAGLAAVSRPLMATIGPNWVPASAALQILCAFGMAFIFAYFTGPLLQALSRTRQLAVLEWLRMVVGTAILVVAGVMVRQSAVNTQVIAISFARFVAGVFLIAPIFVYILMRLSRLSLRDFASSTAPSVAAAASVLVAVGIFASSGWLQSGKPLFLLLVEVAIGGAVGLSVLFSLETQLRRSLLTMARRNFVRSSFAKESI